MNNNENDEVEEFILGERFNNILVEISEAKKRGSINENEAEKLTQRVWELWESYKKDPEKFEYKELEEIENRLSELKEGDDKKTIHMHLNIWPAIIAFALAGIAYIFSFGNIWLAVGIFFGIFQSIFPKRGSLGIAKALFTIISIFAFIFTLSFYPILSLLVAFIGYAIINPRYLTPETIAFSVFTGIFRIFLGIVIAVLSICSVHGSCPLSNPFAIILVLVNVFRDPLFLGVFLFAIAFLCIIPPTSPIPPEIKAELESLQGLKRKGLTILYDLHDKFAEKKEFSGIVVAILGICGFILCWFSLGNGNLLSPFYTFQGILFILIGITGIYVTAKTHPVSRGEIGFVFYLMILFSLTTAYPGVLGKAVFGEWWPQVNSTISPVFSSISDSFSQFKRGMSDAWLMFTCPQCYYEKKIKEIQARSQLKKGGTIKSLEVVDFKVYAYQNYLDPERKLRIALTLQNQGEFPVKNVIAEFSGLSMAFTNTRGEIKYEKIEGVNPEEVVCTGWEQSDDKGCKLENKELLPKSRIAMILTLPELKSASVGGEGLLGECICKNMETGETYFSCGLSCSLETCKNEKGELCKNEENPGIVYMFGGREVKLDLSYQFSYQTNVSLQFEVISEKLYNQLFTAGKIEQQQTTSIYSGGPVKASLSTQFEPIPVKKGSGSTAVFVFAIQNTGTGMVKNATITISVPRIFKDIKLSNPVSGYGVTCPDSSQSNQLICKLTSPLSPGETRDITFDIKIDPSVLGSEEIKTLTLTARVDYIYGNTISRTLTILPAPFQ